MGDPTVGTVAQVVADLENRMAAIHASLLSVLKAGDPVICGEALYSPSLHLITERLADCGISSMMVDTSAIRAVKDSIQNKTKVIFYETPANPTCKITDIQAMQKGLIGS